MDLVIDRPLPGGLEFEVCGELGLMLSGEIAPDEVLDVDVESPGLGPDEMVAIAAAAQALIGRVQAQQLKAVERLRRARGDDRDTADEVGLALSVSKHAADAQVELARQLATRFPHVRSALERGDIDAHKASRVAETAAALNDERALALDADVKDLLKGRDAAAIQQSVRYRVDKVDPEGAAERHERRKRTRRVEFWPDNDGMASLFAYLPADVAAAAYGRIDAIAKSNKTRRDPRSLDEIRSDVLTELLLGKHQYLKQVRINVTIPVTSLLGATDLPADLQGYGWIPAAVARQMAADPRCTWRRLLCDPVDGQLMEVGRTRYKPPKQLDEFVRHRDRRCRVAGCNRPAWRCEVDHNHDWGKGGPTDECLLCCLCRRHHRLKDRPGWDFQMIDGDLIITTPTGRTYHSKPPPAAEPEHLEPEPEPADPGPPPF